MTATEEQVIAGRAASAAAAVASRLLGTPITPVVLHHSRHITVLLQPIATVARVASLGSAQTAEALGRELAIARHLLLRGAPVVSPSTAIPAGPHVQEGFAMTFWPYLEHGTVDEDDKVHVAAATRALRQVHDALADLPGSLPSYLTRIEECGALLAHPSELAVLPVPDRDMLRQIYDTLIERLARCRVQHVPIHGEVHLGQCLMTPGGPCWADLESVCLGPREWDLCWLADLSAFEPVDPQCYEVLHLLRSLCVSVWCWAKPHLPGKLEAAQYHLGYLKSRRLF